MSQTGFTPIQLYRTSTASAVPTAGNLADGELAINLTDERLYFKNAAGTVKLLAANITPVANGGTGSTSLTANNVLLGNGTSALQVVAPGTAGNVLTSNGTTWTSAAVAATLSGITQSVSPFETSLGHQAGNVTTGVNNTWIGYQAGLVTTTGTGNTGVGFQALDANINGSGNVALGSGALGATTAQGRNTAIGFSAASTRTAGEQNVHIGYEVNSGAASGNGQVIIGYQAAINATGDNNTVLGYQAGSTLTTGANNTVIGNGATSSAATVSNEVTIGNGSVTAFRIPGLSVNWSSSTVPNVTATGTQTLTNKRIDPRDVSAASASSLTPDVSVGDIYAYTALAAALTINAPIGTPTDGDKLIFRLLDNGTARALTWNATYVAIGVTLPTTTVANKTTYVGCMYNANNTRWDVIAVTTQA